jgi:MFS family permease
LIGLTLVMNTLGRGVTETFAVFLLPVEKALGATRSEISATYSIYMIVNGFAAPFAGQLIDRLGARATYGAGLILLQNRAVWILVGVGLILLPHIIGAPQPDSHESDVPAALATSFTVASLGASAVFWLVLGTAVGWLLGREAETSGAAEARPG